MPKKYLEEKYLIKKYELLEYAALSVLRNATADIPGIVDLSKGNLIKKPLRVYDINGKPLFYDYTIKRGVKTLGTVRMGASKILGTPAISYEIGPRYWDFRSAVNKLIPRVRQKYPERVIRRIRLICYSYPKLGVMFEMIDRRRKLSRLIFDIAHLSLIPEIPPEPGMEGAYAWSFYNAIPDDTRKLKLKQYNQFNKWRLEIPEKKREMIRTERTLIRSKALAIREKWWPWKINVTKKLQFCPHYNYNETRSHHCFVLHGQQKNDYCAVATCQMILCYYRYYYIQNDIAPALNYTSGSGCPANQSAGYEKLTCNHLDATFDTSPKWEEARDQIKALHPLKSGIPGHARTCAGYSYVWWIFGEVKDKKLLIYDPWPWNADYKLGGSVYWEDWNSITHTNFIYTKLLCP